MHSIEFLNFDSQSLQSLALQRKNLEDIFDFDHFGHRKNWEHKDFDQEVFQ